MTAARVVVGVGVAAVTDRRTISLTPKMMIAVAKGADAVVAVAAMVLRSNVRIVATATATMSVVATGTAMTIAGGTVPASVAVIVTKQMLA